MSHGAELRQTPQSLVNHPKTSRLIAVSAGSILLFALFIYGCGNSNTSKQIEPVYDKTGRLQLLKYDANNNGRPETFSYMDGGRIVRIEIDKDEDGKIDRWEYYDQNQKLTKVGFSRENDGTVDAWSYPRADGSTDRIEFSTRRDGKVTRTEYYEKDAIVRAEEDADEDGTVDKWETYQDGHLTSVSFDAEHAGRPTNRLIYTADGNATAEHVDAAGHWIAQK